MRETDDKRARAATVLNGLRRDLDNAVSTLAELDEAVADGRLAPIPTLFVDPAAGPDFVEPARHPLCDGDKSGPCGLPAGHFERVGSAHVPAPWREHVGPGGVGPLPGE